LLGEYGTMTRNGRNSEPARALRYQEIGDLRFGGGSKQPAGELGVFSSPSFAP